MYLRFLLIAVTALFFSDSVRASVKTGNWSPGEHTTLSSTNGFTTDPAIFNLQDFGSAGDGITDDGPALQRALDAAAQAGGGIVYVPAGRYAIVTAVTKDFSNIRDARLTIQGVESFTPINVDGNGRALTAGLVLTSEFVIKTGETANALTLSGLKSLLIKDIAFIGTYENISDALVTLSLTDIADATIRHSEFYGLASFVYGGAIVQATHSRLKITEVPFLGCTVGSGYNGSVVQNISWKNISITDTVFADYGLRPGFYGKTTWGATYSWIGIGNAAGLSNLSPRREAFIEHVFLDEGHIFGIASRPDLYPAAESAPIELIYISRLRMNVNNLGFSGLYLYQASRVFVEESYFGWSQNASAALAISEVGEAILDKLECVEAANTIAADAGTGKLTIINSVYEHLSSSAQTTQVINTATATEDPVQYVAQQFRDELEREPDAAAHVYWTNQLLSCAGNLQCVDERRLALANYLSSAPSPTFSITGRVSDPTGAGLSGVAVALSGSQAVTTYTDNDGAFTFADLPTSGQYVVTPAKRHYTFNSADKAFITPSSDLIADFTAVLNTHVISGTITVGGNALSGVTVTLSGDQLGAVTTNSAGTYSFTVDAGGTYTLTAAKTHYTCNPSVSTLSDVSANKTINISAALNQHRISGRVLRPDGTGLAGVAMVLSGSQTGTITSGSDGTYSFVNLGAGGNYTITASKANHALTPQSRTFDNLGSDQSGDFNGALVRYRVSGRITVSGNGSITGLGGVTLTLGGSQTGAATTDANGNYSFADLLAEGSYTITPSKKNYHFTPETRSFNNLSAVQVADFTAVLNAHVISGTITAGGNALSGVTVTLSGDQLGTATTNSAGTYSFTVNAGGNYTLTPTRAHYTFTPSLITISDLSTDHTFSFSTPTSTIQFSAPSYSVCEDDGSATITVTRVGDTTSLASFFYFTTDASGATQTRDYTMASGMLNFAPGETSKTFTVLITDDAYVQGTHALFLQLGSPTAFRGTPYLVPLSIEDNDIAQPTTNPIDNARAFVRQHYADFLNRVPDQAGLDYWSDEISRCGTNDACLRERRIGVSAAFFVEQEFQQTGFVIYRLNSAALGLIPSYTNFMTERNTLQGGGQTFDRTHAYVKQFVQNDAFIQAYPESMTAADFVNKLFNTAGLTGTSYNVARQQAIQALQDGSKSRAEVLLDVIEIPQFKTREFNPAFVLMQYYGYLRRDPDSAGYQFWLNILNNKVPQDSSGYRAMVCAFISSAEYQARFSSIRTHTDEECGR